MTSNNKNPKNETLDKDLKKLEDIIEKEKEVSKSLENQLKYLQADFDNYRKFFEKEKQRIIEFATENLIKDLLPIIDDFEKAKNSNKDDKGLEMLYNNLMKTLRSNGLEEIKSIGEKFDPNLHDALMSEKSDKEEGIILEEFQKGFRLKSKIIRHSKVKISKGDTK